MRHWLLSRILTVGDVGRWHGAQGYPRAGDHVELPLYAPPAPEQLAPVGAEGLDLPEPGRAATPERTIREAADGRR